MKLSTPLTRKRIQDHFSYNFWKYLLVVALSIFGWNMFYVQTEYRPPEEKRIDLYVQSAQTTAEQMDLYLKPVWDKYVPDMEIVQSVMVLPSNQDNYMTDVQLTTYLAARQGDIYILSGKDFKKFASQGAFLPMEDLVTDGTLNVNGMDLSAGYVTYRENREVNGEEVVVTESHLYGIPAASLNNMANALEMDTSNLFISVTHANNNDANVFAFLDGLIQEGQIINMTDEGQK